MVSPITIKSFYDLIKRDYVAFSITVHPLFVWQAIFSIPAAAENVSGQ